MKILIAEDEAFSRRLLEMYLVRWGYDVMVARDGIEAWQALHREGAPKLAVLDWLMPGMTGLEICRRLRQQGGHSYVYVLLLTMKAQKQDIIEGLEAGADDYLAKPFDANELRVRLRAGQRILHLQDRLLSARNGDSATHDALTGQWNRIEILNILRRELERGEGAGVGLLLIDVDCFRQINHQAGTLAGDTVLREVARRLQPAVEPADAIGRYGSDEFLVVSPKCTAARVLEKARMLRRRIHEEALRVPGRATKVTVSVGVVTNEDAQADADSLLRAVEAAVTRAKAPGYTGIEIGLAEQNSESESAGGGSELHRRHIPTVSVRPLGEGAL